MIIARNIESLPLYIIMISHEEKWLKRHLHIAAVGLLMLVSVLPLAGASAFSLAQPEHYAYNGSLEWELQGIKDRLLDQATLQIQIQNQRTFNQALAALYEKNPCTKEIDDVIRNLLQKSLDAREKLAKEIRDLSPSAQNSLLEGRRNLYMNEVSRFLAMREIYSQSCPSQTFDKKQKSCPPHAYRSTDGACYCNEGYEVDVSGKSCVQEQLYTPRTVQQREETMTTYPSLPPDVKASDWYAEPISDFVGAGYISNDENFLPHNFAIRGEFVRLIVELNGGILGTSPVEPTFDDTPRTSPYYEYLEEAAIEGWITGKDNCLGTHPCYADPYGHVNRAEAAALINRAFGITSTGRAPLFVDNPPGQWFTDVIQTAADNCILQGDGRTGKVRPEETMNRAEMVVMLHRIDLGLSYPNC